MTAFAPRLLFPRPALLLAMLVALAPSALQAQLAGAPEAPATEEAVETKTIAVVAVANYDQLMKEINFLGELGGRPATAEMVEGMIAFFTGGRGVEGLDKSRPLGVVLQTDGMSFAPIVCAPIADLSPVLELAENFGFEPVDAGDGVYEMDLKEQTVYFQNDGEWSYFAQTPEALAQVPADPSQMLKALTDAYDVGATVMVQNVPEMYQQIALEQLRQGMEEGFQEQLDEETEEEFAERRKLAEAQIDQLSDLIQGLDVVTLGWSIDSEKRQTFFDALLTGVAGSDIALAMDAYKDPKSGVNGFHRPKSAMSMLTVATTPPALLEKQKEQSEAAIEMVRTQLEKGMKEQFESGKMPDDPAVRAAIEGAAADLIDIYAEMILGGRIELGGSLDLSGEGFDMVMGGYVPDPKKVESAFKKLADAAATQEGFPGVEWGYATHGGVTMHGMTIPVPEEGQARQTLGESVRVVMGLSGERVYLAVGPRGEESLKRAIDESAASADKAILPGELIVSVGQILTAAEKVAPPEAAPVIGMVLEAMKDVPEGTDRLVVTSEAIDNGVRVRYLLEEGVLKAIGNAAATAAAMQQQGGGGEGGF